MLFIPFLYHFVPCACSPEGLFFLIFPFKNEKSAIWGSHLKGKMEELFFYTEEMASNSNDTLLNPKHNLRERNNKSNQTKRTTGEGTP